MTSLELRKRLAAKAFSATAAYDSMISSWFSFADQQQFFPDMLPAIMNKREELRYGENPHQKAALYLPAGPHSTGNAQARSEDRRVGKEGGSTWRSRGSTST